MSVRVSRPGMTLLEVIVALTVTASALAAGAGTLGFLSDRQATSSAPALASAHAMRTSLRSWLEAATLTTEGDAELRGVHVSRAGGNTASRDELTFLTRATTPLGSAGTVVHLYITDPADSLHGVVAELRPWRAAGASMLIPLATDATGLRIRYLPSTAVPSDWRTDWVTKNVLPVAFRFEVQFPSVDQASSAHALLAVPLTVVLTERR